jgi:hypothetical protein
VCAEKIKTTQNRTSLFCVWQPSLFPDTLLSLLETHSSPHSMSQPQSITVLSVHMDRYSCCYQNHGCPEFRDVPIVQPAAADTEPELGAGAGAGADTHRSKQQKRTQLLKQLRTHENRCRFFPPGSSNPARCTVTTPLSSSHSPLGTCIPAIVLSHRSFPSHHRPPPPPTGIATATATATAAGGTRAIVLSHCALPHPPPAATASATASATAGAGGTTSTTTTALTFNDSKEKLQQLKRRIVELELELELSMAAAAQSSTTAPSSAVNQDEDMTSIEAPPVTPVAPVATAAQSPLSAGNVSTNLSRSTGSGAAVSHAATAFEDEDKEAPSAKKARVSLGMDAAALISQQSPAPTSASVAHKVRGLFLLSWLVCRCPCPCERLQ